MWLLRGRAQEYYAAGEFTVGGRICGSLKANAKFYSILGALGLLGLIYLFATKAVNWSTLVPVVLTIANTATLAMVVVMLGYGLVEVPRLVWRKSSTDDRLRLLHFRAPDLDMALYDARCGLDDVIAEVSVGAVTVTETRV